MKYSLRHYAAKSGRRYLGDVILLAAILALTWSSPLFSNNSPTSAGIVPQAQLVSIARPAHQKLSVTATLPGVWIAREEVVLSSSLEGLKIEKVLVESGEHVVSGQLLAILDHALLDSQILQADQAVKRARAEFAHTNEQYLRAQRLMPSGAVSKQDLESIRATMLAAQATLQQARVTSAEQRIRQKYAEIRAPFTGVITKRGAQAGAMIGAQNMLFHLAREPLEFEVQVPQQLLPDLVVGMKAKVNTSGRNNVQDGSLRLISAVVDTSTGYGQSRVAIAEPDLTHIRPGTVGSAHVEINVKDVLAVDARALRFDNAPYVFMVVNGRAKRTPIKIGLRQEGWIEVVAGLDSTSLVVLAGARLLQDGDPVTIREADSKEVLTRPQSVPISVSNRQETDVVSAGGKA